MDNSCLLEICCLVCCSFLDIGDIDVLKSVAADLNWDIDVNGVATGEIPNGKKTLIDNTNEIIERGGFGVPR